MMSHGDYMRYALSLGERHRGLTKSNPSVGCVIVKDGVIVGLGMTSKRGRPHAEVNALKMAGEQAKDADVYVTLEPCAHKREVQSCSDALIEAKIKRCFVGMTDPDPRTKGQGIEALRKAGIEVFEDILVEDAQESHKGFISRIVKNRPFISLKLATSLDGRISFPNGVERKKITDDMCHKISHHYRSKVNAIAVGGKTILSDNPTLDCRLHGVEDSSPDVVIFAGKTDIPLDARALEPQHNRRIFILYHPDFVPKVKTEHIIYAPFSYNLENAMVFLAEHGINHILIEGGSQLVTNFINHNLYDEILWFNAPLLIGEGGIPALAKLNEYKEFSKVKDQSEWLKILS